MLHRLLSEGFRVFFLAAGLWAVAAMALWTGWLAVHALGGMADLPTAIAPHLWHGHEMIFGYGAAAAAGFFLAALLRWSGSTGFAIYDPAVIGSGLMWCLAFLLFLAAMAPVLSADRLPRPAQTQRD